MADTNSPSPSDQNNAQMPENKSEDTPIQTTNFLSSTETASKDAIYHDLFQKNSNGDVVTGTQQKRSPLEIFTSIMTYVTGIIVLITILSSIHVFIRSQQGNAFAENFPFLCPYLNYDIETKEDKWCRTAAMLEAEYKERQQQLNTNIVNELATYIPLKVSTNIIDASSEKTFIVDTFDEKIDVNQVVEQFERIRKDSESLIAQNITCTGLSITDGVVFTTQCTVYGGNVGEENSIAGTTLWSARVEAARFLEKLANTSESSFILQSPPTVLPAEAVAPEQWLPAIFTTKTTTSVSLRFVPFSE